MFARQAGSFPSALRLLLKAAENHPSFPAPHQWGDAFGLGANPRGMQQRSGCTWTGPMARSINMHALGLETRLLGWTEKAWRCFIQASGENRAKLRNSYPGMTNYQGKKGGHQSTRILIIKPELELSSPQKQATYPSAWRGELGDIHSSSPWAAKTLSTQAHLTSPLPSLMGCTSPSRCQLKLF